MEEEGLDLTGVHPRRWNQVRARVRAIREYLKLPRRGPEEEARFAQTLGISSGHFRRLVSIWRRYHRASALPGSSLGRNVAPDRRRRMPAETSHVLAAVIDCLGSHRTTREVQAEVERRCRAAGFTSPHLNTIREHLKKARLGSDDKVASTERPTVIIDHCAIDLPASWRGRAPHLPFLSVAVAMPEHQIVAFAISTAPPSAWIAAQLLLQILEASSAADKPREIRMNAGTTASWRQLLASLREFGVRRAGDTRTKMQSGSQLSRLTGGTIGKLKLRPRLIRRRGVASGAEQGSTLSASDVQRAVAAAIREFNAKSTSAAVAYLSIAGPESAAALSRALRDIGRH